MTRWLLRFESVSVEAAKNDVLPPLRVAAALGQRSRPCVWPADGQASQPWQQAALQQSIFISGLNTANLDQLGHQVLTTGRKVAVTRTFLAMRGEVVRRSIPHVSMVEAMAISNQCSTAIG